MTSEPNIDSIFCQAVEINSEAERRQYLERACGADMELRARVHKLLAAHLQAGRFMQEGDECTIDVQPPSERPGVYIGPYKLRERLGEGGMGVVWAAEQKQPLRRKVAIKVIKPGMDSSQVIARFEAEREALALMDHSNIARVLDAGTTEQGRPYFVMELIRGVTVTDYCDAHTLTIWERLNLFTYVCKAVQHAHQKGIIHRDIKPSNVLVTEQDGIPIPKVIDFGVAKALHQPLTDRSLYTGVFQAIGTLAYMSPEQATLSASDVDTRADVYGLGVLLYELLTGSVPFDRKQLESTALDEACRIIREQEPLKPSTKINTLGNEAVRVSQGRRTDLPSLTRAIHGELDWIVMTAMEKDRNRRYESASAFADDVQHFLSNEPVRACPKSISYRLRKFAHRNQTALATIAVFLLAVLLGLVGTSWQAVLATRERQIAMMARDRSEISEQRAREAADEAKNAWKKAEHRSRTLARLLYSADMSRAMVSWDRFNPRVTRKLLYRHRNELDNRELLGFEWYYLWGLLRTYERHEAIREDQWTISIAFSADGKYLAATHPLGATASVWDVEKRKLIGRYGQTGRESWRRPPVAFSPKPGSARLAFPGTDSSQLILRELNSNEELAIAGHKGEIRGIAFSPSGDIVATASSDGTTRLWNAYTGRQIALLVGHAKSVSCVTFSHDGNLIATGGGDRKIRIWEAESFEEIGVLEGHEGHVLSLAFSSDDQVLASGSSDRTVRLWDVKGRACLKAFTSHEDEVRKVVFSHSDVLVSASRDRSIRMWDVTEFRELDVIGGYGGSFALALSPDGETLAYVSQDYSIMLREQHIPKLSLPLGCDGSVRQLTWLPDAEMLFALADFGKQLTAWRFHDGKAEPAPPIVAGSKIGGFAVSPTGQLAIGLQNRPVVQFWNPTDRVLRETLELPKLNSVRSLAFSGDGQRLGVGGYDGEVAVYDIKLGAVIFNDVHHAHLVSCLAFSPDGRTLATGSHDRTVRLWDVESGKLIRDFGERADVIKSLAFSSNGGKLAVAVFSKDIELWDPASEREPEYLQGHSLFPADLVFAPDGTLFSAGAEGIVRLWDPELLVEKLALCGNTAAYASIAVSPNGQTVAAGARDGSVEFWHAASEKEVQESGWDQRASK